MCKNAAKQRLPARFWPALLALGIALGLLGGCRRLPPVVKIGLVGPFEGAGRAVAYDALYSARLAVRQVNQAGGIDGYRLALVALDDRGDPELARQAAASLLLDPGVVAVVGHWLPATTAAAAPIYAAGGLALVAAGTPPFGPHPEGELPPSFTAAYEAVTPFDEMPGPYAGTAYDAFQLLFAAMEQAVGQDGTISRPGMAAALPETRIEGITGPVSFRPFAGQP